MTVSEHREGDKLGQLSNKNIVITGASSGVGYYIATKCAQKGANLILLARRYERLQEIKQELHDKYSANVRIYKLDVSDTDEIQSVFSKIIEELSRIDVLVNNAGYGVFKEAHASSIDDVKGMFDVNVVGLIACTSIVLPLMRKQRHGHIINIASQAGKIATPKSSIYSATKHAVLGYSNSIRMELSDLNIYVTTVNPGPIETDFFSIADEKGTYVKSVKRYILKPDYVAERIVDAMLTNTREINLPRWMNIGSVLFALFPSLFERVGKKALNSK